MKKVFGPAERSSRLLEVESEANGKFSLCVKDERGAYHTIFIAPSDAPALALAILEAAGYDDMADDANLADVHAFNAMHKLQESVDTQERATAEAKEQAELEAEAVKLAMAYDDDSWLITGGPLFSDLKDAEQARWLAVARKAREMRAEK